MIGLDILLELGAKEVHIIRDSQLVLQQLTREYKCNNLLLAPYYTAFTQLLAPYDTAFTQLVDSLDSMDFEYLPRESNCEVDC